jgi:lipopolysaccharide transport system ATP-binding protein
MTDIAIRVDNLSKLYHLGAVHQRPDTLRDALTGFLPRISRISRKGKDNSSNSLNSRQAPPSPDDLWALKDVSFEACPEFLRRIKRGEVVGTPARASGSRVIGRNGAGTLAPARSAGESTLLKILSRIAEPTSGRAETCGGRVGSLLSVGDAAVQKKGWP